jgi:hypothetical protein
MIIRSSLALYLLVAIDGTPLTCAEAVAQDVRALCSQVVTDDQVRSIPKSLIPAARRTFGFSAKMSDRIVQASTVVRCMNGIAWLCNYGANLVCEKADVSRNSPGAEGFCRENPDSIGVPMSATGHATVYEWKCVGQQPRIIGQVNQVDARGFIADNWKPLR